MNFLDKEAIIILVFCFFGRVPYDYEKNQASSAQFRGVSAGLFKVVGCVVGPLGAAFGLALNWANATRAAQPWLLYLLPVSGLVIVFLYEHFDPDGGSVNQVFTSVRERKPVRLRSAPLIFVSTVITRFQRS